MSDAPNEKPAKIAGKHRDFAELARAMRELGATQLSVSADGTCSVSFGAPIKQVSAALPSLNPLRREEDREREERSERAAARSEIEHRQSVRDYASELLAGAKAAPGAAE